MKSLIVAIALFTGAQAFASMSQDCTPYLVSASGDNGEMHYVYPCGPNYNIQYRGCVDGEVGYFPVDNASNFGGQAPYVTRVCHNGSFFPADQNGKGVTYRGCTEGEISYGSEQNSQQAAPVQVTLVCHNGTFVPMNP